MFIDPRPFGAIEQRKTNPGWRGFSPPEPRTKRKHIASKPRNRIRINAKPRRRRGSPRQREITTKAIGDIVLETGRPTASPISLYLSSEVIHPAAGAFDDSRAPLAARIDTLSYAECGFELHAHAPWFRPPQSLLAVVSLTVWLPPQGSCAKGLGRVDDFQSCPAHQIHRSP